MKDKKVLIIDDDENICQILKEYFQYEGFSVELAHNGNEGLTKVKTLNPDLIILDIMLPQKDGWQICQELRPANNTPIIILSAKTEDTDRIVGLELGADDYVTKPFSPKEVVVRGKAVLRRTERENKSEDNLSFPGLSLDKKTYQVSRDHEVLELTPKEFALLWMLASSPKQVFTREELLTQVWGYDYYGDTRTVDTHIKSLRGKLGSKVAEYIKTVWGVGYKFEVIDH